MNHGCSWIMFNGLCSVSPLNDDAIQPTSCHSLCLSFLLEVIPTTQKDPTNFSTGEKVRYPRLGSFEVFVVVQKDFAPNNKLPEIMQVWSKLHLGNISTKREAFHMGPRWRWKRVSCSKTLFFLHVLAATTCFRRTSRYKITLSASYVFMSETMYCMSRIMKYLWCSYLVWYADTNVASRCENDCVT